MGTIFSELLIKFQTFPVIEMQMSFAKWRPFCFGLNALSNDGREVIHTWRIGLVTLMLQNQYYHVAF